jgi:hypothetical protein
MPKVSYRPNDLTESAGRVYAKSLVENFHVAAFTQD